jgi:hypothetical protein
MASMSQQRTANPDLWLTLIRGLFSFLILMAAIWGFFQLVFAPIQSSNSKETVTSGEMISQWKRLSENSRGRVIYARPPRLMVLDLNTGRNQAIPNIQVEGGPGRKLRGSTPRPFWSPDGKKFIYRYQNRIWIGDIQGNKREIRNTRMDTSKETRWSWWRQNQQDWAIGPSRNGNIIMVNIIDPTLVKTLYSGGDVKWWCELTGTGEYVVFDTGSDIFVAPVSKMANPVKISKGQSCRPCAAPDNRVAWLPASHTFYRIFKAENGRPLGKLLAPPREGIYRLNWSNHPDFAVHMYGSAENQKMHVRRISTGEFVWIGSGWDPDLWVSTSD